MVCYAVIDTNVFISALLTRRADSATVKVLEAVLAGKITPLYNNDIIVEYNEVLHRSRFCFSEDMIQLILRAVVQFGVEVFPKPTGEILADIEQNLA